MLYLLSSSLHWTSACYIRGWGWECPPMVVCLVVSQWAHLCSKKLCWFQYAFTFRKELLVSSCASNGRIVDLDSFQYESSSWGRCVGKKWELGRPCKCDPLATLKTEGFLPLTSLAFSHFLMKLIFRGKQVHLHFPTSLEILIAGLLPAASLGSPGPTSRGGCPPCCAAQPRVYRGWYPSYGISTNIWFMYLYLQIMHGYYTALVYITYF